VIVAGVLLTGGTSRRLGTDKAALVFDGETLAVRAARALTDRGLRAVEVGPGHTTLPAVREDPPGRGPLAALVAGVIALREDAAPAPDAFVLLACDLPHAGPVLDALLAAPPATLVVPLDPGGMPQYVCARYSSSLVDRAVSLVRGGELSLRALVSRVPDHERRELTGLDPDVLADIDTPADARRLGVPPPVASP
jgi:molybdopterin-guanine dinucleotide biosynthesis protein A